MAGWAAFRARRKTIAGTANSVRHPDPCGRFDDACALALLFALRIGHGFGLFGGLLVGFRLVHAFLGKTQAAQFGGFCRVIGFFLLARSFCERVALLGLLVEFLSGLFRVGWGCRWVWHRDSLRPRR